jgi:tRNA dimethylallyltransferase
VETLRPVIAIVGPTASGKSALAMKLAEKYEGEIICADSRTIYKGMDIGTAKPSIEDRSLIAHHCLDLVVPTETFSAAEFKARAQAAIKDIHQRQKTPFIVGGSGLYIDGLLYDFEFGPLAEEGLRKELEGLSDQELVSRAKDLGIKDTDINFKNRRHLARAIERGGVTKTQKHLPENVLLIGVQVEKDTLRSRIESRVDDMFESGLLDEAKSLFTKYGTDAPGLLAPGYKALAAYTKGEVSFDEAKQLFINADNQLAKRQMTWFKRNKDIAWTKTEQEADSFVVKFLSNFDTIVS